MNSYPPAPWLLTGQLHATSWLVRADRLPQVDVPGWRPVVVAGRTVVGTVWVSYEPDGMMTYDELMATVLMRHGARVVPSVVRIWVDSVASRDGGRALWGIPKELARFDGTAASTDAGPIAGAQVRRMGRGVSAPVRFDVVQRMGLEAVVSPVRARGRVGPNRTSWQVAPDGPLGFLTGARQLAGFSVADFTMAFGGPSVSVVRALDGARGAARQWSSGTAQG